MVRPHPICSYRDNTVDQQTYEKPDNLELFQDRPRNIIVFGECGVGKSSLINLLAEEKVCATSSGALGCTLEYTQHSVTLGNERFVVWDTAGLDEGSRGAVPAEKAEAYLKQLLHGLCNIGSIDLLVYCVRGTRARSALLTNYHVFYSAICRKKVPIAIVITGLENQEGGMESWWHNNKEEFFKLKMFFDSHACVTTLSESPCFENTLLQELRAESKKAVTEILISTSRAQRWQPPERSWFESAYSDVRAMLSSKHSSERLPTIIMCEASRDPPSMRLSRQRTISFHKPVAFSRRQFIFRMPVTFSSDMCKLPFEDGLKHTPQRVYRVYQVARKQISTDGTDEETKKAMVVRRGADLLLFCVMMNEADNGTVKSQWEHFNFTYGGDLSPHIVVVDGASNQKSAEEWWKAAVGETQTKNGICVAYWPTDEAAGTEVNAARELLQGLIDDHCVDCSRAALARKEALFIRPLSLDISHLAAFWTWIEGSGKEDGSSSSPNQDILTQWKVWAPMETYQLASPTSAISKGP